MDSANVHLWSDVVQNVVTTLGIAIGGLWAYVRFVRDRVRRPKLEMSLAGEILAADASDAYIRVQCSLKNVGLLKTSITHGGGGSGVGVFQPIIGPLGSALATVIWADEPTTVCEVLALHDWIEPGETITDWALVRIPAADVALYKLRFRVVSGGIAWNTVAIVDFTASRAGPASSLATLR
jgi:hypothetical protein